MCVYRYLDRALAKCLMGFDLIPRKLKVVKSLNIQRTSIWGIYFIIALSEKKKNMPFFVKVNSIDVISSF